jgi:cytochrome c-type biogenesis protein CcmH
MPARSRMMILLLLGLALAQRAAAVVETYEFSEPTLEQRYYALSQELRCPKCQNQNIADSDAPIARDLRQLLHSQLEEGASDDEILEYMVARYGEFVRYRPRFGGPSMVLWLAPGILLLIGACLAVLTIRSRSSAAQLQEQSISAEEAQRVRALLAQDEDKP